MYWVVHHSVAASSTQNDDSRIYRPRSRSDDSEREFIQRHHFVRNSQHDTPSRFVGIQSWWCGAASGDPWRSCTVTAIGSCRPEFDKIPSRGDPQRRLDNPFVVGVHRRAIRTLSDVNNLTIPHADVQRMFLHVSPLRLVHSNCLCYSLRIQSAPGLFTHV